MTIWIVLLLLAVLAMTPLAFVLGGGGVLRGRRDAAVALHRAQLVELDRDLSEARIAAPEHATARLEVQRRLIAAADTVEEAPRSHRSALLTTVLLLVPVAAFALYLPIGSPGMPDAPLAARLDAARRDGQEADRLLVQLRQRLAQLDPAGEEARQGYVLMGNVEANRQGWAAAAAAWQTALKIRFDATLAVETAEALTRADGHVGIEAAAMFHRALNAAPADAPWRPAAEARLASSGEGK